MVKVIFLLSLLIQMMISSRNTHTDTPRNNVLPALLASVCLGKVTLKMRHHSRYILGRQRNMCKGVEVRERTVFGELKEMQFGQNVES